MRCVRPIAGAAWLCAAALGLLPALAAAGPLDPGATLCLHPLVLPETTGDTSAQRADVQRRLVDALTAASYLVPDPATVASVVERVRSEAGGVVDPLTGRRDEARYGAYRERRAVALAAELGCDAELFAQVVVLRARFVNGTAEWDGTSDAVSSDGRAVLNLLGGVTESGWVAALSLWLRAADLHDEELAFRAAGIESLVSLGAFQNEDVLPDDVWLTDVDKVDAAIRSALGAHGERLRTEGTPEGADRARQREDEARRTAQTMEQLRR